MAKYWSAMGHQVFVVTTRKTFYDGPLNFHVELPRGVEVHEVDYGFLHQLSKGVAPMSPRASVTSARWLLTAKAVVRRLRRVIGSLPDVHDPWLVWGTAKALRLCKEQPFDFVFSSYSPPASHAIACLLKKRTNVFWVADYRDLWSGNEVFSAVWPFSAFEKYVEGLVVRNCDLITTVSERLRQRLAARFGDRVVTIENGFDPADASRGPSLTPVDKVRLVHAGTIYYEKQDPSLLLRAVRHLAAHGVSLDRLEIAFYGSNLGPVARLATELGLDGVVKVYGFVDRQTVLAAQRGATALLFFEWPEGVTTAKMYEYIGSGTPVITIGGSPESEASQLVARAGVGVSVGGCLEEIAAFLRRLVEGDEIPYSPRSTVLSQYSREQLARKLLEAVIAKKGGQYRGTSMRA